MRYLKILLVGILLISAILGFKLGVSVLNPGKNVNKTVNGTQIVYVKMPDGEKLLAEVHYGNKTEITVKLRGKTIAREELPNGSKMSKEEIESVVKDMIRTLRSDEKLQAMTIIIYWGEKRGIPSDVCTKAANEFGKCLDEGKNPDECVKELKQKYSWIANINFSDLVLLYKNWT